MWPLIVFLAAVTALFAYVAVRQRRHVVAPGKRPSAEAEVWDKSGHYNNPL